MLLDELNSRKYATLDLGKRKIKMHKEIVDAVNYLRDNGIDIDELIELALTKLPVKKLVKEIQNINNEKSAYKQNKQEISEDKKEVSSSEKETVGGNLDVNRTVL